jgi:hypothetical protein
MKNLNPSHTVMERLCNNKASAAAIAQHPEGWGSSGSNSRRPADEGRSLSIYRHELLLLEHGGLRALNASTERGIVGQRRPASRRRAGSSFFTIARFEPDTLAVFGVLAAAAAALLFIFRSTYLSALTIVVFAVIFLIEASETINLGRAESREIVGARCFVLKVSSGTQRGIARLFKADGQLEMELWSFEASSPLEEGETAIVSGMNSVILRVTPMMTRGSPLDEAQSVAGG